MKLAGQYTFEAPLPVVWEALFDPEVLARTLPGCDRLDREGDGFVGEINVKMGPVQGKFKGKVDIADVVPNESYSMVVDGRGPSGFVKAKAKIALSPEGESTRIDYDADVTVGGRIASVGQRLIDASAKAIVKQSLEGLHDQVKALAASAAAGEARGDSPSDAGVAADGASSGATADGEPSKAKPADSAVAPAKKPPAAPSGPSQAAFAMGVAKEVTRELFPLRTVLWVLALLVVAFLVYRGLS